LGGEGDGEKGNADAMSCCGRAAAAAKALARMRTISRSAAAASSSGRPWRKRQEEPFLQKPRAKYMQGLHAPASSSPSKKLYSSSG
jgi:hypothetical protein